MPNVIRLRNGDLWNPPVQNTPKPPVVGMPVVPAVGPLDAEIILIGESPAAEEEQQGIPFVGRAGKLLNTTLKKAGIDRDKCRVMNVVPIRAPQDKFELHSPAVMNWGLGELRRELTQLTNPKVIVALGANPLEALLGRKPPIARRGNKPSEGFIGQWRGSIIPPKYLADTGLHVENYLSKHGILANAPCPVVATYHPAAILRQFTWHPWLLLDLKTAAYVASAGAPKLKERQWYINNPSALTRLAKSGIDLISVDSEMNPKLVAIATEDEVHVFEYDPQFHVALKALLESPKILKVAQNWLHDASWFRVQFGIDVAEPIYDTEGGAQVLNSALQKELSPHISTRYTPWPYHKWLVDTDPYQYCGMDAVVCYDAYWNQIDELHKRDLYNVAKHDHHLLYPLMDMQRVGFKIDGARQTSIAQDFAIDLGTKQRQLDVAVKPIIQSKLPSFKNPHLFQKLKRCPCCGGGKVNRQHCLQCGIGGATLKQAAAQAGIPQKSLRLALKPCIPCGGGGKVIVQLPFNPESPAQLADIIYRGLGIRPRRFKGSETTRVDQLDAIKDKHPLIAHIIDVSQASAELATVKRLTPGIDGRLHCVFNPWGTGSGRVAGSEGLVEKGTNPMNIPVKARELVVPDNGMFLLYPDKAQIEARAVAVLANDQALKDALTQPIVWPGHEKHGKVDSHTRVQQLFDKFGVSITRDQAKRFTYAGIYGGGAAQLAVELNADAFKRGSSAVLSPSQVQMGLDAFFRAFPRVRQWQLDLQDEVLRTRRLRCPYTGRERTWTGYIQDTKTKGLAAKIAKEALSFLPQNMAAWILGLDLLDLWNSNDYGQLQLLQPLIHVHDALLMQAPMDRSKDACDKARKYLTRTEFGITFPSDLKVGHNWLQASCGHQWDLNTATCTVCRIAKSDIVALMGNAKPV